ncbi:hypothetical protein K402DRAFT_20564 [Aulographum hederae CBS 113979]|uniref:Uncharacterized protein n=1 Tax=Aulographum hederae CBS 113979 TaxID=1176131 RepID=A0A6G1H6G6_9PEZI|nr:hypothetical protein K402DRAFT_20564 [Aulographum hederae CBS 113979]
MFSNACFLNIELRAYCALFGSSDQLKRPDGRPLWKEIGPIASLCCCFWIGLQALLEHSARKVNLKYQDEVAIGDGPVYRVGRVELAT